MQKLIPIAEAYPYIGCRRAKIYQLVKNGEITAVRIGTRTFLEEGEIARFREKNQKPVGYGAGGQR